MNKVYCKECIWVRELFGSQQKACDHPANVAIYDTAYERVTVRVPVDHVNEKNNCKLFSPKNDK